MRETATRASLIAAALLALVSARPYAASWNDASRLATVESLVERGTFAIDESIYVDPARAARPPFSSAIDHGTQDKLWIDGRYYSDKPPVPALPMAAAYQLLRWCGLPPAAERPDLFARVLTWLFAGLPYLLAVVCVARTARHLGSPEAWQAALTVSLAFGSLAAPYAQHVNAHVLQLAVAAASCEIMFRPGPLTPRRVAWLGCLAGLAYAIDLGAGALLALCIGGWVAWRRAGVVRLALCALPWIAAHHALNWSIAGTFGPAAAQPEFFAWPGSPFHRRNLTGSWLHRSPAAAGRYALALLVGWKGFLWFSLPLVQVLVAAPALLRERRAERPALVALACFAVGTWLLYATLSNNHAGHCLSIRWFVPLLAPGYAALAILVCDRPSARRPLAVLVAGGLALGVELVWRGPWTETVVAVRPLCALTLAAWLGVQLWPARRLSAGGAGA